jgi:hypothetical protein
MNFTSSAKNKFSEIILCIACIICNARCFSQNEDSVLLARSEKWEVKQNKGLFGLSKPAFASYITLEVTKVDSPVMKKKTKDSSYSDLEFSGDKGTELDLGKFMTIEKKKFYRLKLSDASDTTETVFAISSISHEKKKSFLGTILSKNGESTGATVLDYNRNVPGIIIADSSSWQFFIENFTSGSRQTEAQFLPEASISGGYLKTKNDSLYMQIYSSFAADIILVKPNGEHVAGLAFKQKHPAIWIRHDIGASYQNAIATLFAVIIAIKDY